MKKYKILIVHNYYQIPGGEDTVVENERKMLLDNGHEVVMYTRHNNEIKRKNCFSRLLLGIESIFSIKTFKEIKKIIKNEKIDIVHVHNTLPLISPSVYYAAKSSKSIVVQTLHNFRLVCPSATLVKNNEICERCLEKNLICSIKNKCYRNSYIQTITMALSLKIHRLLGTYNKKIDGYIALTEFNKNKFKTIINKEKIFIKPNFAKDLGSIDLKESSNDFLYLGRLDKTKGINFLVKVWPKNIKEKLLIVGSGVEKNKIEKYLVDKNITNIKLLGYKDKNEIKGIMENINCVIVPSQWYEPFGMVVVEAMERGKIVIGSNIGAIPTIIVDDENGFLFNLNSEDDLLEKIHRVINNKDLNRIKIKARESFEKNYSSERNYNILMGIYNYLNNKKIRNNEFYN